MKEQVYVAWRNPNNNSWHPVGLIYLEDKVYHFVYTKGAITSGFPLFTRMRKISEYHSTELFPVFYNRIISERRPEYKDFLSWLDVKQGELSPLKLLGLTEGIKPTDHLEFFQCPVQGDDKKYKVLFILHGLQYVSKHVIQRVNELKEGERLYLVPDPQNEWHPDAMMLRTGDPIYSIGYCPRYLSRDFNKLLRNDAVNVNDVVVIVKKVNKDAPLSLRLLCQIIAPWPDDFLPCDQDEFDPILNTFCFMEDGKSDVSSIGLGIPAQFDEDFSRNGHFNDSNKILKSRRAAENLLRER